VNNHGAIQNAAAGAYRHFTAPCSVTCEASLHMATVTSHGPATDTGLGFYDIESPPSHSYFGIITSVKDKDVLRITVVLIHRVKLILIRIKYKSEEIGREENNKNKETTRKIKSRKIERLMPSYLSSKCQGV
jgi:hypothetical protein